MLEQEISRLKKENTALRNLLSRPKERRSISAIRSAAVQRVIGDITNAPATSQKLSEEVDLMLTLKSGISLKAREFLARSFTARGVEGWASTSSVRALKNELAGCAQFEWIGGVFSRSHMCKCGRGAQKSSPNISR